VLLVLHGQRTGDGEEERTDKFKRVLKDHKD
jgi:hypothetical protein